MPDLKAYRVMKMFPMVDDETGQTVDYVLALVHYQRVWRGLSPTKREALRSIAAVDGRRIRNGTLRGLIDRDLIIIDGRVRLTILGEAVLHYAPEDAGGDHRG